MLSSVVCIFEERRSKVDCPKDATTSKSSRRTFKALCALAHRRVALGIDYELISSSVPTGAKRGCSGGVHRVIEELKGRVTAGLAIARLDTAIAERRRKREDMAARVNGSDCGFVLRWFDD